MFTVLESKMYCFIFGVTDQNIPIHSVLWKYKKEIIGEINKINIKKNTKIIWNEKGDLTL